MLKSLSLLYTCVALAVCVATVNEAAAYDDKDKNKNPAVVAAGDNSPFKRPGLSSEAHAALGKIAVQANGRVKPLDTLAREGISLLTGKFSYKGLNAVEFFYSMLAEPQIWKNEEFVQIRHLALKKDIGLIKEGDDEKKSHFSPEALFKNEKLMPLFNELARKQEAGDKLDPYFQAVQRINNQIGFVSAVISGRVLRLVPPKPGEGTAWLSLDKLPRDLQLRFTLVVATYVNKDPATRARATKHAETFKQMARDYNPEIYPTDSMLNLEYWFNKIRPFRWGWILALLGTIAFTFTLYSTAAYWYWGGIALAFGSMAFQILGFTMRCIIAGRPPVTNMYESVIWVAAGTLLFGLFFELKHRNKLYGLGSMLFTFICLLIADNIGSIMDDGIHPLEPVLRSNFWLTVHVLTITLSYAAFSLSLILSNMAIFPFIIFGKESSKFPLKTMAQTAYRSTQIGVVLLAAGTILGGVWADYSWGRFWGWDPKETWALIALMGYLALLHARFRGMVKSFGFLAWSIVSYLGVLMAWYGVNFVLGAGLHSYGFSTGGLSTVTTYVVVQLLLLIYGTYNYRRGLSAS